MYVPGEDKIKSLVNGKSFSESFFMCLRFLEHTELEVTIIREIIRYLRVKKLFRKITEKTKGKKHLR